MSLTYEPASESLHICVNPHESLNHPAAEREGNNWNGFTDVYLKNGSSQGQNPALTVLFVANSLDSGSRQKLLDHHTEGVAGTFDQKSCGVFSQ